MKFPDSISVLASSHLSSNQISSLTFKHFLSLEDWADFKQVSPVFPWASIGVPVSISSNRPFSYSTKEPGSSVIFYTFLYTRFDRVALELLLPLCKFENSTECSKISFDFDSRQNS